MEEQRQDDFIIDVFENANLGRSATMPAGNARPQSNALLQTMNEMDAGNNLSDDEETKDQVQQNPASVPLNNRSGV